MIAAAINPKHTKTQIISEESPSQANQNLITQVQILLNNLTPITNYGYYHGGYNYTYQHQIVGALAKTKTTAIELALQAVTPSQSEFDYNP
ncbi:MAG: hypothetical protein V7K50_17340 [Nostoc sp.]|uniref:hypothetical protein n=1 Tax=Nostoc sp. TaxID=1180 RepID=UPI002FFBA611